MTNLMCDYRECNTVQKAKVFECFLPSFLIGSEVSRHFLLVIEKCKKCGQKKIFPVGLTYSGSWIPYGFLKPKQYEGAEENIFQEHANLPGVKRYPEKKGFYLLFSKFGVENKCYSNLSAMSEPVPVEVGRDIRREAVATSIDRFNKAVRER